MKLKVPAIVGGVVGLATAGVAAGLAYERNEVVRARALIDAKSAARFGAMPIERESVVDTDDGVSLHVEEVGPLDADLTVLFVHGFTLNLGSFHYQRQALSEALGDRVRLVFYDHRSHGRSGRSTSESCTVEQLGRDLATVIDTVAPAGPVMLIGHSMGGMTIMELAEHRPELFLRSQAVSLLRMPGLGAAEAGTPAAGASAGGASAGGASAAGASAAGTPTAVSSGRRPPTSGRVVAVVLINTSAGNLVSVTLGLPNFVARLRGPLLPVVLRRAAKNVALIELGRELGKDLAWIVTKRLSFASSDVDPAVVAYATNMIAATPVDVVSDFYRSLMGHDGSKGLLNLGDVEVLVFGADHDALTPLSHAEAIADALPRAELITVAHAGHLLMLEHPDAVNEPILKLARSLVANAERPNWVGRGRART